MQYRTRRDQSSVGVVATSLVLLAALAGCADSGGAPVAGEPGGAHAGHGSAGGPPSATPLRDGERFLTLELSQPYRPAAPNGGTDEYRCFLIDPGLSGPAFLTGSQFLPQNVDIVHHAIFFRIDPSDVAEARRLDARTPGQGWTCFGGPGVGTNPAWVAHWAPGADETLLDPALGYALPSGSQLVMQVHYNLWGASAGAEPTDRSGVRLRLVDDPQGRIALETKLLPASVELPCAEDESGPLCDRAAAIRDVERRFGAADLSDPAATNPTAGDINAAALNRYCEGGRAPVPGPTRHCDYRIAEPGVAYAVAGHMHLLGRAIRVDLNPGTDAARTLLDLPNYNFDEQAIRPLDAPVTLRAGDTLRVTCTHDVSLRKQVPQLRDLPPRYVVWGEGTADEMCLGLVLWAPKG